MTDMNDIRARWTGVEWHYGESREGDHVASACLTDGQVLVGIEEPNEAGRALLQRCTQAPSDVQTLLDEIEAARVCLDDDAPTLQAAVESAWRFQQELIAAYQTHETALVRRAEQAEAGAASWLVLVREAVRQLDGGANREEILHVLGDAVDRASTGQPGRAMLTELETLRARCAGLSQAAAEYSASRDRWYLAEKAARVGAAALRVAARQAYMLLASLDQRGGLGQDTHVAIQGTLPPLDAALAGDAGQALAAELEAARVLADRLLLSIDRGALCPLCGFGRTIGGTPFHGTGCLLAAYDAARKASAT